MTAFSQMESKTGFFIIITFVVPMGLSCGLGEPTSLGLFSKTIGSENISGWGTGTGLAGVLPQLMLLLLNALNASNMAIFLIFSVFAWFYIVGFAYF